MKKIILITICILYLYSCDKDPELIVTNPNEYEFYDGRILHNSNTTCGDLIKVDYLVDKPQWYQVTYMPINLHDSFKTFPPAIPVKGKLKYLSDSFSCEHDGSPSVIVGNGKYIYRKVEIIWIEKM